MKAAIPYNNLSALARQLFGDIDTQHTQQLIRTFTVLPCCLHECIFYYYILDRTDKETAHTLNVSEHLVRQRISVAITLLRILYASKPKNPV